MQRLAVLALPVVAAAVGAAVLLPGAGGAQQTGGPQTFTLDESGTGPSRYVDLPPKATRKSGPGAGDEYIFTHKLKDSSGKAAGTISAVCTFLAQSGKLLCTGQFNLAGGTITGTTLTGNSRTTVIAITGGTGAYEGARGTVTSVAKSNSQNAPSVDTIHLLG